MGVLGCELLTSIKASSKVKKMKKNTVLKAPDSNPQTKYNTTLIIGPVRIQRFVSGRCPSRQPYRASPRTSKASYVTPSDLSITHEDNHSIIYQKATEETE